MTPHAADAASAVPSPSPSASSLLGSKDMYLQPTGPRSTDGAADCAAAAAAAFFLFS